MSIYIGTEVWTEPNRTYRNELVSFMCVYAWDPNGMTTLIQWDTANSNGNHLSIAVKLRFPQSFMLRIRFCQNGMWMPTFTDFPRQKTNKRNRFDKIITLEYCARLRIVVMLVILAVAMVLLHVSFAMHLTLSLKWTTAFGTSIHTFQLTIVAWSLCGAFSRSPFVNTKLAHAKVHSEWSWRNENMILHLNFQHAGLPCWSYLMHSVHVHHTSSIVFPTEEKKTRQKPHSAPMKETLETSDSRCE